MRAECRLAASAYQLALPANPLAGRAGERLGKGTGSSLEFMDFRDYVPGDDLRHIDWRAYARTDQFKVRLFREEVSPDLEIVADLSRSMTVTKRKEQAFRDMVEALAFWTLQAGSRPRRLASGGDLFDTADTVAFDEAASDTLLPTRPLKPMSIRFLLSDFLFPGDPGTMIRRFASGAARIFVIQLLDSWELDPDRSGPLTLIDCETAARIDLDLNSRSVGLYKERLGRLCGAVKQAVTASGGMYACVKADTPHAMFREGLMAQNIVEPA